MVTNSYDQNGMEILEEKYQSNLSQRIIRLIFYKSRKIFKKIDAIIESRWKIFLLPQCN
jgi:hypothetical protein